jgi:hypothetical protein
MAETSGFWTTTSGTPTGHQVSGYSQAMHALALRVAGGVKVIDGVAIGYRDELEPSVSGSNVVIAPGGALVDGKYYDNTDNISVAIPASVPGTTRYDRVVVRVTWANYTALVTRVAGINSGTPAIPDLTQNRNSIYDVPLALVHVDADGTLTLTDDRDMGRAVQTMPVSLLPYDEAVQASSSIAVGAIIVPEKWHGAELIGATAGVFTVSSSGNIAIRLHNTTLGVNLLTTNITIDAGEQTSMTAATPPVIDSAYKTLSKGQVIRFFVESAGTGAKGLQVDLIVQAVM